MDRSKHPMDILNWIEKIINSCENRLQVKTADKLLDVFCEKYIKDSNHPYYSAFKKLKIYAFNKSLDKLIDK
jgi:uncharacterized protein involved in tolerance to divalent cations